MQVFSRAKSGIKSNSVSQFGRQALQITTTIILTRYLSPSDFGLMSMAFVITGFLNVFRDLGTSPAIIRQKEISDILLSTIYWFNIFFGFVTSILIFSFAPMIARFYEEERLITIFQLLSISFILTSIGIAHQAILEKNLNFSVLAKIELTSTFIGSFVGIIMSIKNYGVLSLVFQTLVTSSVSTILLVKYSQWKPMLNFQFKQLQTIAKFSLNLTGFNVFNFVVRNADNLLIGKYLGAQQLGYYNLAYKILVYPVQNISSVVSRVMFPVFSQFQEDDNLFRETYLKMIKAIAFITFPLMLGLMVMSKHFVLTVLGKEWEPVIMLLIIFSPIGLIQSIDATTGIIFQAKGKTDWMFWWGIATGILSICAFIIGLQWGILGVAFSYLCATLIWTYPGLVIPLKFIGLKFMDIYNHLFRTLIISGIMSIILFISSNFHFFYDTSYYSLLSLIILWILLYGIITYIFDKSGIKFLIRAFGNS